MRPSSPPPCMPATVEDAELAADLIDHCGGRYV
jgi:hypothetical protein